MNYEKFLNEKGMGLLKAKQAIDNMEKETANIIIGQFDFNIAQLMKKGLSDEDFIIEVIKKNNLYGKYPEYLKEKLDYILATNKLNNYSLSINDRKTIYLEKVVRINGNFIKNFFAIDISNDLQYKNHKDFLFKFTDLKSKAILNDIKWELNGKIDPLFIKSKCEERKIVIMLEVNKNDKEDMIVEKAKNFLDACEKMFNNHIDVNFKHNKI